MHLRTLAGLRFSATNAAFYGSYSTGRGIFTRDRDGGPITKIAKSGDSAPSGTFSGFSTRPVIRGTTVAFTGNYGDFQEGIFTGSGGALTTIAKTGDDAPVGTFSGFGVASISDDAVAFQGFYTDGFEFGTGIFTHDGSSLETMIETGDSLFGSTITDLHFDQFGLDGDSDSGALAFLYELIDGRSGIAIALPAFVPGDLNADGVVDGRDLDSLASVAAERAG